MPQPTKAKQTPKRKVPTKQPERHPTAKTLIDRLKRDMLTATDAITMLESKCDAITAQAQAEADLVQSEINDLSHCVEMYTAALNNSEGKTGMPIPSFLSKKPNVLKMAVGDE